MGFNLEEDEYEYVGQQEVDQDYNPIQKEEDFNIITVNSDESDVELESQGVNSI